ncbi:MAG TPA: hypothetical protein VH867_05635 [Burkholderiales bacterium]
MQPAPGIRKLGFRRWFERQLIESHVYLVTCFLCLILVLAVFEELGSGVAGLERALMFATIIAAGALGLFSWERYRTILFPALRLSERSTCENCGTHARFSVIDSGREGAQETAQDREGAWLKVKCAKCGHQWTIA